MGIYSMEIVVVSALALFAAAEVCSQVVRAYPGAYRSWRTWRTRIFVACGAGLIIFSGWPEAALSRHPTVFWLAQGPNLWITVAAVALIMVIVMICSNYMVPIQVAEGALLLGFAATFWSGLFAQWLGWTSKRPVLWSGHYYLSYFVALAIWYIAVLTRQRPQDASE